MTGNPSKTLSLLYNVMVSTTYNRNVIRQGGISSMVESYSYEEIQIQSGETQTINASNMTIVSTDTPLNLQMGNNTALTISNFFVLEGVLSNFILENASSGVANVIIITC